MESYRAVREEILPRLPQLAVCRSLRELEAHPVYRQLAPLLKRVLATPDAGSFADGEPPARERLRVVAWNVERGTAFDEQLHVFRCHPYIRNFDLLLLTECDLGMARSGNRAVAQDFARELRLHYAFTPCYLNLTKGSGVEREVPGENQLALHGNAILSRYPLSCIRPIPLANGIDKIASPEKRLGSQAALAAVVTLPGLSLTAASVHLDAQSSQRHRWAQMRTVLDALPPAGPALLGGDWNTTTYDSSRALWSILGFWLRVFLGVDHVIRNHYLYPGRWFERDLFALLGQRGFDCESCNLPGEPTILYEFTDHKTRRSLGEWVPAWCFPFIRWALRRHGGKCPFKLDWLAARGLRCENPVVVHDARQGSSGPLSDHDPVGVDLLLA